MNEQIAITAKTGALKKTPFDLVDNIIAGAIGDDEKVYLRRSFGNWRTGRAKSMNVALGLTGATRKAARNASLLRAAALIDAGRNLGPWELAGLLAQAIKRFHQGPLAVARRGLTNGMSAIDAELLVSVQTGAVPLKTQVSLYDLLQLLKNTK